MKLIKETVRISKPMCFLCGPYYEEKTYDRRKILREFLITENKVIPIIVDKFLDKANINNDTINVDLLEEICAAVSFKTYIFLDTFSSVAELGMFCSAAYQNQIDVFIPKNTDIISNNIGYFVKEIIENNNNDKINCFYYRPKIVRVPIASDYVTEFYEFTKDELPQNFKRRIMNDEVYSKKEWDLKFKNDSLNVDENGTIGYYQSNSMIKFTISVRMLFYLVTSILLEGKESIDKLDVNEIVKELKELIENSFCICKNIKKSDNDNVEINTKFPNNIEDIITHILEFIKLYNIYGDSKGRHIITKQDSFICELNTSRYFGIDQPYIDLISEYISNPDNYIEIIKIKLGKKIREITKYKNDENGNRLRRVHELILNKMQKLYLFSDNSYAYRKGYSIFDCVTQHKNSISFVKIDIKSFFNSIKYRELYEKLKAIMDDFIVIDKDFKNLLKACMYNNMLPLGLVTSPILSDIYLHEFDNKISDLLNVYSKKIIFTRYADDMFFSSEEEMNKNDIDYIVALLSDELKKISLQINHGKTVFQNLVDIGDHIKILGLNIVKTQTQNNITVGKKFINDTCKMFLDYLVERKKPDTSEDYIFYTERRISGRIAYIKQAEGTIGFDKIKKRIAKSTSNRVNILGYKIRWIHEAMQESAAGIEHEDE